MVALTDGLPRITVITTGGTIASRVDPATGLATPAVRGDELVAMLPGVEQIADLTVREQSLLPSWDFTTAFMHDIALAVTDALEGGADGVVVTQGTDTLEETAYWLDLTVDARRFAKPVVVTGAMRNASEPGADGPRNLLDAIAVAAHGSDGAEAPVVVANGEIHAGRFVVKTDSYSPATFQSPGQSPLGYVVGRHVSYVRRDVVARSPLHVANPAAVVPLLTCVAGMDDRLVRACLAADVDGVVVAGFGLGHIPGRVVPAIRDLREQGIPVVMTTRSHTGPTLPMYGGAGGGQDLLELGVVFASRLPGPKARLLLIASLGAGVPASELPRVFAEAGR